MERILIIGCPGSGKTTVSKKLSKKLNLPLINLDQIFWKPGWKESDRKDFDDLLQKKLIGNKWIIEGNYRRTMPDRIKYADTVIYINLGRWICSWRVIKRFLLQKELQAEGCPQKINLQFLTYVFWHYHKKNKKTALELKKEYKNKIKWITLKTQKEVDEWIKTL